jgi:hypothetical protein
MIVELFFIAVYGIVMLFVLFPSLLDLFESVFGVSSAINFIVYLSVFVVYFLIFLLYQKTEDQRIEITKLTREIGYLKHEKRKK